LRDRINPVVAGIVVVIETLETLIIVLSQFAVTACVRGTGFAFHLEGPEHVK